MSDPHENAPDENPERHIGRPVPDPWRDGEGGQAVITDGMGADDRTQDLAR